MLMLRTACSSRAGRRQSASKEPWVCICMCIYIYIYTYIHMYAYGPPKHKLRKRNRETVLSLASLWLVNVNRRFTYPPPFWILPRAPDAAHRPGLQQVREPLVNDCMMISYRMIWYYVMCYIILNCVTLNIYYVISYCSRLVYYITVYYIIHIYIYIYITLYYIMYVIYIYIYHTTIYTTLYYIIL